MPQPSAADVQAKLRARYGNKAGSTRTGGGKNAMRRKKFRQKKSTNEFEKRLQSNLKKLSCNTIPGIEEVNLFKSDGTVIHFVTPKVDAEVSSNTFIVSGNYTHNKIEELLPDILPQIGSDHLNQLKDYAEKFEALKPQNDDGVDGMDIGGDDGDVPMLIDEDLNFEAVAQSDEKKEEKADDKASDDAANDAEKVKDETTVDDDATASADKADESKADENKEDNADNDKENVEQVEKAKEEDATEPQAEDTTEAST